jgi:hypothetical protein
MSGAAGKLRVRTDLTARLALCEFHLGVPEPPMVGLPVFSGLGSPPCLWSQVPSVSAGL